jgi:hypothetical protein
VCSLDLLASRLQLPLLELAYREGAPPIGRADDGPNMSFRPLTEGVRMILVRRRSSSNSRSSA